MSQTLKIWKISLLLLLGLFVFLYILASTIADVYWVTTRPVAGVDYGFDETLGRVVIKDIAADGPAAGAGFKKGDAILSFNAVPIATQNELERAYNDIKIGQSVEVKISRGSQELTLTLVMQKNLSVYFREFLMALLFGAFFCYALCLLGMLVFLKKIQDRTAHVFYLMLLFWALAMRHSLEMGPNVLSHLSSWLQWILLPAWPFAVGALLHFYLIFPVENRVFQKYRGALLALIYLPVVLILPFAYAVSQQIGWAGKILNYGWGIWLTINFIIAMFVLSRAIKRAPNPYIKRQAQIMADGTALSLSIPLSFYFLPQLFFNWKPPYADFSLLFLIVWPVSLAYVIVKHRFMDINVIVKKGVAYALMSGFVIAAYFLLVLGAGQLVLFLTGSQSQIVTIVATLLIAALFNPVKNRVQNFVERRFYPHRFVYREAVHAFSHRLVNVVDLAQLIEILKSFLVETMRIWPVTWFTLHETTLTARAASNLDLAALPTFTAADKVIKALQQSSRLVDLSPLKEALSDDEKNRWEQLRAELALPLLSKGNLVGMITLGAKDDDEPYYKEDLELLATLGDQINIALENALLTEKLREQDRLKKELEVARRIQLSSLPQADPQIPGLDISGISIPALEVGGDYYDYLDFADGRFGVVVGDVSGKGTSAALYMSQLKGILQAGAKHHRTVKELVVEVNAITFRSISSQSFITLMCGAFDIKSRRLSLVRAGHLPLLYYSVTAKACRELVPKGIGVGLENGKLFQAELEEIDLAFAPGDVFLFCTDGITEARDRDGREFEMEVLASIIRENGWENAIALREKIIAQVHQFAAADFPHDDMTLVVVKAN